MVVVAGDVVNGNGESGSEFGFRTGFDVMGVGVVGIVVIGVVMSFWWVEMEMEMEMVAKPKPEERKILSRRRRNSCGEIGVPSMYDVSDTSVVLGGLFLFYV